MRIFFFLLSNLLTLTVVTEVIFGRFMFYCLMKLRLGMYIISSF